MAETFPYDLAALWEAQAHASWKGLMEHSAPFHAYLKEGSAACKASITEGKTVCPPPEKVFRAFSRPPESVRVLILGQDPYHTIYTDGTFAADGLAFSCPRMQPSLRNILKEVEHSTGRTRGPSGTALDDWAEAGVLLMNTTMTVPQSQAHAHKKAYGNGKWAKVVVEALAEARPSLIVLAWGRPAQGVAVAAKKYGVQVLKSPHPSPLSAHRGFFGCGHFALVNTFLEGCGESPIPW